MTLPEKVQHQQRRQIAVETLINAAETGGGWLMFARIAMMRALDGSDRQPLFQRRIHRRELGVELGSDALNRPDDRERYTGGDQTIFDSRRAGLIRQEF
jgi:hypothetical protein